MSRSDPVVTDPFGVDGIARSGPGDDSPAGLVAAGECLVAADVDAARYPRAARSYLADGRGVAWFCPRVSSARFVIDAELLAPVRPVLVRRYGLRDEEAFARAWTRAEALAKLADVPIITWLSRYGLDVPDEWERLRDEGTAAWRTEWLQEGIVMTRACLVLTDGADRGADVVGGTG